MCNAKRTLFILTILSSTSQAQLAPNAMPGIARVGFATEASRGGVAVTGGYGWTEDVLGLEDSHHRFQGDFAAAVAPIPELGLGLRVFGRFDKHRSPNDTSAWGAPQLLIRPRFQVGSLNLGLEASFLVPGSSAPSFEIGALVFEANAMLTWANSITTVGVIAGYRHDRSTRTINATFSRPDLLSLGLNEDDAIRLGVGLAWRVNRLELLAEADADLLLSDRLRHSPVRIGVGTRFTSGRIGITTMLEVSPSSRPEIQADSTRVNVEPRLGLRIVLSAMLGPQGQDERGEPDPRETQETQHRQASGEAVQRTIQLRIRTSNGPSAADVRYGSNTFSTDAEGNVELTAVQPGAAIRLEILVPHYQLYEVELQPNESPIDIEVPESLALPRGQIRGAVRDFRGNMISAVIRIPELDVTTSTSDGEFEIDAPPGAYQVQVRARGFQTQTRSIVVEEHGVTILNVDLRRP